MWSKWAGGEFGFSLLLLVFLGAPEISGTIRTGCEVPLPASCKEPQYGSTARLPLAFSHAGGCLRSVTGNQFSTFCSVSSRRPAHGRTGATAIKCEAANLATETRAAVTEQSTGTGAGAGKPKRGRGIGKGLASGQVAWEAKAPTEEAVRDGIAQVHETGYFASVGLPPTVDTATKKQTGTRTRTRRSRASTRPKRGIGSRARSPSPAQVEDEDEVPNIPEKTQGEIELEQSSAYFDEIETEWTQEKEALKASSRNSPKPAGARWRSRSARRPGPRSSRSGNSREMDLETMLRKNLIVAKGTKTKTTVDELFYNPGFLEMRRDANEREARMAGGAGSLALADLKRRGLLADSNSGDIRRSLANIDREIPVSMAIFDMKVLGDMLFTAGSDDKIYIWDTKTWTTVGKLEGHTGWINALLVDEDSGRLCSASEDGTVKIWDLETWKCVTTLRGHQGGALSIEFAKNNLYVGCSNKIIVWDTKDWTVQHKLSNHTHVLRAMSKGQQLSKNRPLDPMIAMAREPSKLFGRKIHGIQHSHPYVLAAVDDGTIWVWNTKNMEVERKLLGPRDGGVWVRPIRVAPFFDPKTQKPRLKLISGWADGALRIYDLKTWKLEHTLAAHSGPILSLDVQGEKVISAGADMAANEWDSKTWTLERALRGHNGAVCAVSTAQKQVVTASLDGFMKVWTCD